MASILNNCLEVRNDILNCTDEVAIDNICNYIENNGSLTLSYIDNGKEMFKRISFGANNNSSKTYYVIDNTGNKKEYNLIELKILINRIGTFKIIYNNVELNSKEIMSLAGIKVLKLRYLSEGKGIASHIGNENYKNFSDYILNYIKKYKIIDIINSTITRASIFKFEYNEELNAILCIIYAQKTHKEVRRYKIELNDFSVFLHNISRFTIIVNNKEQSILDIKKFAYINGFDATISIALKSKAGSLVPDRELVAYGADYFKLKEVLIKQSEQLETKIDATVEQINSETVDEDSIETISSEEVSSDTTIEQINSEEASSDTTIEQVNSETVDEDSIEKESYNPSYEKPEQLKKLFNCQDKSLKPSIRILTDEVKDRQSRIEIEKYPLTVAANENTKIQEQGIKSKRVGCEKCNYTTYIDIGGIQVRCDCVAKDNVNKDEKEKVSTKPEVKIQDVNLMNSVIPPHRRNDEFSSEVSKQIVTEMLRNQGYQAYGYAEYIKVLNNILSSIATTGLSNSYIIGAPNGFSKTTFVYTAIKRLIAKGKKVVPYKSLTELAELRLEYNTKLLKRLRSDKIKQVYKTEQEFTWKDYVDCDVLFTYLSSAESGEIESVMLYDLIKVRSKNGKPTVVMTSQSLQWYTSDAKLMERYWSDILSYKGQITNGVGLDRLIQVACYKRAFISMGAKKGVDY